MQKFISTSINTIIIIVLFVLAEVLARKYSIPIATFVKDRGSFGQLFFVGMAALAVIIPVWSNMFLLPISALTFGPFETALLCILGWWIGAVTSFYIGRMYKEWLLTRYHSLKKYEFVDSYIPKNHTNASLIFLRMTMPVDVLSYALGIFSTRISWKQNAVTTLIGITPFAFIFSYIGMFPAYTQVLIFVATGLLFGVYVYIQHKK